MKQTLCAALAALSFAAAPALAADPAPAAPAAIQATPADVASVDAILAALYGTISGPAGQPRDWNRLRSLFMPEGRMAVVGPRPNNAFGIRLMSVDDYIARVGPFFAKEGFYESEAARRTEQFGQLVHVFSTYESRHATSEAKPFQRGINSIQLYHDGSRWYIVSLVWRGEDDKLSLPAAYLAK
ncbi:hypothetical protein [Massilia sp. TS11]|uniref:hypothetical protein n=1 Tax=Massilia sp. TS11 TaxID=2908003 RepID=UPI001EDBF285|nr:hypothetical protein [Massilia sp. TS11]MCG2586233.1 hypothetical protein [Massilia sp. TS11]